MTSLIAHTNSPTEEVAHSRAYSSCKLSWLHHCTRTHSGLVIMRSMRDENNGIVNLGYYIYRARFLGDFFGNNSIFIPKLLFNCFRCLPCRSVHAKYSSPRASSITYRNVAGRCMDSLQALGTYFEESISSGDSLRMSSVLDTLFVA